MDNYFDKVFEFMEIMGQPIGVKMTVDNMPTAILRADLVNEECKEFLEAFRDVQSDMLKTGKASPKNMAHLIKEASDIQYVLSGFFVTFGIDAESAFEAVHNSNLSKLGDDGKPVFNEKGKVVKGPNYKAPDMMPFVPEIE